LRHMNRLQVLDFTHNFLRWALNADFLVETLINRIILEQSHPTSFHHFLNSRNFISMVTTFRLSRRTPWVWLGTWKSFHWGTTHWHATAS
jgi:hypothetical protein